MFDEFEEVDFRFFGFRRGYFFFQHIRGKIGRPLSLYIMIGKKNGPEATFFGYAFNSGLPIRDVRNRRMVSSCCFPTTWIPQNGNFRLGNA